MDRAGIAREALARATELVEERRRVRAVALANPTAPWKAEDNPTRQRAFERRFRNGPESIQGDSVDFQPVAFLGTGSNASRAVALVSTATGAGSGFMISPELFMTNHHVIASVDEARSARLQFGYELDKTGRPTKTTTYCLDPDACFITADEGDLDFTIIAVGRKLDGDDTIEAFGYCPLSDRADKHALGMPVNIVQHPEALPKCIAIRNNLLLGRAGRVLQYETDTQVGSSGSPVFNDAWEVVALHHWGQPFLEHPEGTPTNVNEGIRVSEIVSRVRDVVAAQPAKTRALLNRALDMAPPAPAPRTLSIHHGASTPAGASEALVAPAITERSMSEDGTLRFTIPIEISIRVGGAASATIRATTAAPVNGAGAAEKVVLDQDYGNRHGYDPAFIDGQHVPMPVAKPSVIAPLIGSGSKAAAGELLYEHFSVKMHRTRRMALFTATNVDGSAYTDIDRKTGLPSGAEGGEKWFEDPRIDPKYTITQSFYSDWSQYFDRGHLTRRSDPTWGPDDDAVRANADTFHFTNCTPQHFRFNESTQYWQGVERFVLEKGAVERKKRACVFQGPVLSADDYADADDVKVPLRFWKIVAWEGANGLKAAGFVVSQEKLLDEPRKSLKPPSADAKVKVDMFRAPITHIAEITGLDFGPLADADTFDHRGPIGAEKLPRVTSWDDLQKAL